jgi:hypothetical protein
MIGLVVPWQAIPASNAMGNKVKRFLMSLQFGISFENLETLDQSNAPKLDLQSFQ